MSRLRIVLATLTAAVCALSVAGGVAGAGFEGVKIDLDRTEVGTQLGRKFAFHTTISNTGSAATTKLIAHLDFLSVRSSTYVDPEDWSSRRVVYLGTLEPGASRTVTWNVHAVSTGEFAAFINVLPEQAADEPPLTSRVLTLRVAHRETLNSGGILPLAIGFPAALALLAGGAHVSRRRRN